MNTENILKILVAVLLCIASICQTVEGAWARKTDMPTARSGLSASVVDGKIYAIGGGHSRGVVTSTVEQYDPATDTWTRKANMQTPRGFFGASMVNGKIYVIGGYGSGAADLSVVEEYDPVADTWTTRARMPTGRGFLSTSVVNGKIYAIGGLLLGNPLRTVEEYDPATDTWTTKADMPTRRGDVSCSTADGIIYAIGGFTSVGGSSMSVVEAYDPATDTWTTKAPMSMARCFSPTCVVNEKIYVIGGCKNPYDFSELSSVEVYDPATDTWTTIDDMPTPRKALTTIAVNGKIYAIGGQSEAGWDAPLSTVEEYEPSPLVVDFNGDGIVDGEDVCMMVEYWHTDEPFYDIAPPPFGDGIVDVQDLILLSEHLFEEILPYGCVAYWKLDQTEGDIAHNSAGENDGICYGEPFWQPANGHIDGALKFDGIDDYITTDFILDPADGVFSVFAWIKGGAPGQVIISQTDGTGTGQIWLGIDPSEGKLMTGLSSIVGRSSSTPLVSDFVITDGQWHHVGIVVTAYQSMRLRNLYIDGVIEVPEYIPIKLPPSDGGLHIGADKNLDEGSFFSGLIDDVRIYDVALTPEQIEAMVK